MWGASSEIASGEVDSDHAVPWCVPLRCHRLYSRVRYLTCYVFLKTAIGFDY